MDFRRKKYYLIDFDSCIFGVDAHLVKKCLPYGVKIKCRCYKYIDNNGKEKIYTYMASILKEFAGSFEFLMDKFNIKLINVEEEGIVTNNKVYETGCFGTTLITFESKEFKEAAKKLKNKKIELERKFSYYKKLRYVKLYRYSEYSKDPLELYSPVRPMTVWLEEKEFCSLRDLLREAIAQIADNDNIVIETVYVTDDEYLKNYRKASEYDDLIIGGY